MEAIIRNAVPSDAEFIAWTLMTALGTELGDLDRALPMCQAEDSLYSWKHARIAVTEDGTIAGCLISYPGEVYERLRDRTLKRFLGNVVDKMVRQKFESETFPGEYYLDSLAVKPECRRHGIARLLMKDGIAKGCALGFRRITLIAKSASPALLAYYGSMDFVAEDRMTFFGEDYTRMAWKYAKAGQ
ncbi:MAG: GNAT family N-acetyltransferase [Bacteroidales bacterium]|nr:GNAT family N-acetyltransferase [Bacteroidales bacterium]MDY6000834.1 GNAT family N-acetyltransferase [Candidatus Cryptobacteroides sp.]